jgi:competence protein ComEC
LDAVFLSHADADHYNALPALLKRFSVETILVPPGLLDGREPGLKELRLAIDASGVPVQTCFRGDRRRRWEHVSITVLHPPAAGVDGSDNANSLVLQIDAGEHSLVLPGDLEPPGTEVVTGGPRPRAGGVLMAPHHGSLSMDAETVLNWARPSETIVSGGQRAARLGVEQMLSQTGSGVHVTAREGAIRVRISGKMGIQVRRWVQRPW